MHFKSKASTSVVVSWVGEVGDAKTKIQGIHNLVYKMWIFVLFEV